ncbi:MAG: TRASH domain-containing protein [Deltaproteobacteria bacterium]|nr:TRASH domain-containing protein [Deltaproteobacteria bacterium]
MKENRVRVKILITMLVAIAAWASFCPYATAEVKTVDSKDVCMVANRVPGFPTIEVLIDGRTYYVCCKNCEARIKKDPALRYTKDPLSRKKINKAEAFIVALDDGSIAYFESRESAEEYLAGMKKAL